MISSSGNVQLTNGQDALCYNYPLPLPFQNRPGVAIAVRQMQALATMDVFFSVRSVKSDLLTSIAFLIRTQWKYTNWIKISVSFLAEDMSSIEANFFNIDTTSLAGCGQARDVRVLLPFRTPNFQAVKALTFLNGFEISSSTTSNGNTPYEVQVSNVAVNTSGVSLSVTVTSNTKVFSVYLSLIAYDCTLQNVVASNYEYTAYFPNPSLSTALTYPLPNHSLDFYGVTGFLITNTGSSFLFETAFTSSATFTFSTASNFQYLSFNYFFLNPPLCSNCPNYPIYYANACYNSCPSGTFLNGTTCSTCPTGQTWNGNACIPICTGGQVYNPSTGNCQCNQGFFWTGSQCVTCPSGQIWNPQTNQCGCQSGWFWNGNSCIQCTGGQFWNANSNSCVCPQGTQWNGNACVNIVNCYGGQVYNPSTNACQCPSNTYWNGTNCITCGNGQYWNHQTNACACPSGQFWNGTYCASCPNGQYWNPQTNSCGCPSGQFWNGTACISCPNGQFWNSQTNACSCPSGQFWNGTCCSSCPNGQFWNPQTNACSCPSGQYWSGSACIACGNGQFWNPQTNSCACPSGTFWNGYSCISCPAGQYWNAQTNTCSCPPGLNWNGFSCIGCDSGRVWNSQTNACECPSGLNWNGNQCVGCAPGQYWNGNRCISCTGGQIWCEASQSCVCQQGYQWNGTNCILPCPQGQISVDGICQCQTGYYLVNGVCQPQPSCPSGSNWNGTSCVPISCPPGTYWNGSACVTQTNNCPAGTFWDGYCCSAITNQCPPGTSWSGSLCVTNTTQCPLGSYWSGSACVPIQGQCPVGLTWTNGQCQPSGGVCPAGTYFSGQTCIPFTPCTGGRVWSSQLAQCVCPAGSFWNGNSCFTCGGGKVYEGNNGCFCPVGSFYDGSKCSPVTNPQCSSIVNSQWVGGQCICLEGYTAEGLACVCKGIETDGSCDRCYQKPNSDWKFGTCQCIEGYYESVGQCLPLQPNPNPAPVNPSCNVATFFDDQQKRCLPCSDGCLSCSSCYACTQCRPEYTYCAISQLCTEICGDGKRFSLQCDDGNNVNGDGCSSDCQIEVGYNCVGGSPNSKDICTTFKPRSLSITQSGQSHLTNKIVLNVRLNYLPSDLLKSAVDCKNSCNGVLEVAIVKGFNTFVSIKSTYIATTTYSFSIEIDFGREPIGLFTAEIGIKQGIALKYFSGVDTSQKLKVDVNPSFMSLYTGAKKGKRNKKGRKDDDNLH